MSVFIIHTIIKSRKDPNMIGFRIEDVQISEDLIQEKLRELPPIPSQISGENVIGKRGITELHQEFPPGENIAIVHYLGRDREGTPKSLKILQAFRDSGEARNFIDTERSRLEKSLKLDKIWFGITETKVGDYS